ncbi:MAG TPA: hypothetical protein VFJ98_05375 [Mycobacteriales bacterium]|nr:hypothetical protein [Mycobacteriales bacterium]
MMWPELEPERPPWWHGRRSWLLAAGVAAAAAVAAVLLVVSASRSPVSTPRSSALPAPGRLLVYDANGGRLLVERPGGGQRSVVHHVIGRPTTSSDGRYLLTDSGQLFVVRDGRVVERTSPLPSLESNRFVPGPPFADHDRWVLTPTSFSSGKLTLMPLGGGQPRSLGAGDGVAADPTAPGLYVSVARGQPVSLPGDSQVTVVPDVRVERRILGQRPRTITTAAQLDQLAHLPASAKLSISMSPSPLGHAVLVVARSLTSSRPRVLLAVIDPNGHLLDHVSGAQLAGGDWSPDGRQVAYEDRAAHRLVIREPAGRRSRSIELPKDTTTYGACVWSPDAKWLSCPVGAPHLQSEPTNRIVVDLERGRTEVAPSDGAPLLWLPVHE